MIGRRHSAFGFAAASALLLWSAFLILDLCCPIAATAPCHGDLPPEHCMAAALEQRSIVSISLLDSSVPITVATPLDQVRLAPVAYRIGELVALRGVRLHLRIDVLRI